MSTCQRFKSLSALSDTVLRPPAEATKTITRRNIALDIENMVLTRSAAGFSVRGRVSIEKARYETCGAVREKNVLHSSVIEVTGYGFTAGRAVFVMFKDARKFVPRDLDLRYPSKDVIAQLLTNCF